MILLASASPEAEAPIIEKYQADGIQFVFVDNPADSSAAQCTIFTDAAGDPHRMGYLAMRTALEHYINGTETFPDVNTGATMLTAEVIEEQGLLK